MHNINIKEIVGELEDFYEIKTPEFKITYITSRKEFDSIAGHKTERWMAGLTRGHDIYAIHPDKLEDLTIHKKDSNLPRIKHELSHVFFWHITHGHAPNWLDEGLACYLDGRSREKKMTKAEKCKAPLYFSKFDVDIYNIGYFTVKTLIKKFGKAKILKLLKNIVNISSEKEFYDLFKDIYDFEFTKTGIAKNLL